MSRLSAPAPIVALVFQESRRAAALMAKVAAYAAAAGVRIAGLVQHEAARADRPRCDMILEELASGARIGVSQDRGAHARGCRLDVGALLRAMHLAREAVASRPIDLVLVNKFGKTECEGGGLRPLIADALERDIPVLVAVPEVNLESWRSFAGDFCVEHLLEGLPVEPAALCQSIGLAPPKRDVAPAVSCEARP